MIPGKTPLLYAEGGGGGLWSQRNQQRPEKERSCSEESAQQTELVPRYGMPTLASSLAHSSELGSHQGTQAGLLLIRHTSARCRIQQALWTMPLFDLCWTGRDSWAVEAGRSLSRVTQQAESWMQSPQKY